MNIEINGITPNNQEPLRGKRNEQAPAVPKKTENESASPSESAMSTTVSLSSGGQAIQKLEAELKQGSEVNSERVEALRALIADGSYEINPDNLAQKLLDFE